MAKNDTILIDAIIEERVAECYPSSDLGEVFEYFGIEQVLKDFDPSTEEIQSGWVDGRDDGGIDGFYVFVNGHLVQDVNDFPWPKRDGSIDVQIIICKHHATFLQAALNSLLASLTELLDFSCDKTQLKGSYSEELFRVRQILYETYRRLSVCRSRLSFLFSYVSRGDSTGVGESIRSRSSQVTALMNSLFSHCEARFQFVGAGELVSLYRRTRNFNLDLPILEYLTKEPNCYVALARLDQYCHFVTEEDGSLRRYLFDSNIRDYLGRNLVNEEIAATLSDVDSPDFWWLNNGVTILATDATLVGKLVRLQDIQIVNGLQTTECIFRHFQAGNPNPECRALLVKIIVSTDPLVRDRVIRATNSQSAVELASLRATDEVQRDIEDVLSRREWYYERRTNYYRNIGKPHSRFVTPMYLAAGYVALVMKNPALAARLKPRFMKNNYKYSHVFSSEVPLAAWVVITEVLKRVEQRLCDFRPRDLIGSRGFVPKWRNLVALLSVARVTGRFSYGVSDLADLDVTTITPQIVREMWKVVQPLQDQMPREHRRYPFVEKCCRAAEDLYELHHAQCVGRQNLLPPLNFQSVSHQEPRGRKRMPIPPESLVQDVDRLLPPQPWIIGVHRVVAKRLNCKRRVVYASIQVLIERGARFRQEDGVVYDNQGQIIAVDRDRVRHDVKVVPVPHVDARKLIPQGEEGKIPK